MKAQINVDVTIVGAGVVGTTLACALAATPLRIALIDSTPPPRFDKNAHDIRVSAINYASQQIFTHLGAWSEIQARRVSPFRRMIVWDESGQIEFDATDVGQPQLGHIIENSVIAESLHAVLTNHSRILLMCPAHIDHIAFETDVVSILLHNGDQLRTRLLVGADGSNSRVRTAAKIEASSASYGQRAIVANVHTTIPHRQTAWQRFLRTGPVAFLPLADHSSSIVWTCDNDRARELLAMRTSRFGSELQAAVQGRLGVVSVDGERRAFALWRRHANRYIAHRTVLVGDAAHVTHPLAGLGVNLGILDAAALAETLSDAANSGKRDAGAHNPLRRFERWRRGENALVLTTMDAFKHGFASDSWPIEQGRNFGLKVANELPPLRRFFMRRAMGLDGDLPKLAKPL